MSHLNLHLNWPSVLFTAAVGSFLFALVGRASQRFLQKLRDQSDHHAPNPVFTFLFPIYWHIPSVLLTEFKEGLENTRIC